MGAPYGQAIRYYSSLLRSCGVATTILSTGSERPRKEYKIPKVISKEEIKAIIANTNNIKHRCIVQVLYSAGLRRSELLNLKLSDIDSKRMLIKVHSAKSKNPSKSFPTYVEA